MTAHAVARHEFDTGSAVRVGGDSLTLGPVELMGARIRYERDAEIYGEGEPAEFAYKVISGAVRTYKLLNDGRRQIGGFHLPGDLFGLEAGVEHRLSAEAIGEATVLVIRRSALLGLAAQDAEAARALWTLTAADLERAQNHLLLLGRKSACERVASFLTDLAARQPAAATVDLPMSRQDMADYLGLTIETVSRTLTQLQNEGVIALPSCRKVVFCNRQALSRLNA